MCAIGNRWFIAGKITHEIKMKTKFFLKKKTSLRLSRLGCRLWYY